VEATDHIKQLPNRDTGEHGHSIAKIRTRVRLCPRCRRDIFV
jgi:hypothetical protein